MALAAEALVGAVLLLARLNTPTAKALLHHTLLASASSALAMASPEERLELSQTISRCVSSVRLSTTKMVGHSTDPLTGVANECVFSSLLAFFLTVVGELSLLAVVIWL